MTRTRTIGVPLWIAASCCLAACSSSAEGSFDISDALALSHSSVAPFHGGRRAAASYTFDDGPSCSFAMAKLFETHGLRATFFINPAFVAEQDWALWKGLSAEGHEVGNHSMSHLDLSSPGIDAETLAQEITGAQLLIEERLGEKPLTFAFPFDRWSLRAAEVVLRSHLATRTPRLPFGGRTYRVSRVGSSTTVAMLEAGLASAIAGGAWFVVAGHGIDGVGWNPMSSDVLEQHLALVAARSDDVWVDTFKNVSLYRLARESAHVRTEVVSRQVARIELEGTQDPLLSGVSLTVQVPVVRWPATIRVRDRSGADVPFRRSVVEILDQRWTDVFGDMERGIEVPVTRKQEVLLIDLRSSDAVEIEATDGSS